MLTLSQWYLLWKCVVDIWPIFKSVTFNDIFLPQLSSRSPTRSKLRNSIVLMKLNDAFGPTFCLCLIVDIFLVKTTVVVSRKAQTCSYGMQVFEATFEEFGELFFFWLHKKASHDPSSLNEKHVAGVQNSGVFQRGRCGHLFLVCTGEILEL